MTGCEVVYHTKLFSALKMFIQNMLLQRRKVKRGLVCMVGVQLSVDFAHSSPAVSWQRFDWERVPGQE